ncbi:SMI1/KNR4 family protein [Falsarthrobacter nasiphocae]|uniref:Cell wall assembly regulator SMI1 n=1 Tax=Falsarthrobacter nasiphocae TaxID=189863 RepID=A0AAE4C760_9MICC|nr:SMI1/KNR4 family protein [Falsarthrobacter nasiphocae]MDR6892209.1 cell wall assembly regulator SMI1 [Falsarthrobacter nasiphocae]
MEPSPYDPKLELEANRLYAEAIASAKDSGIKDVKRYLGRKAFEEIKCGSEYNAWKIQLEFATLFAMAELTEALELLFRGKITQTMALQPQGGRGIHRSLPTFRWCAEKTNLTGYAELFSKPNNAASRVDSPYRSIASREIRRIAYPDPWEESFYGTLENPSRGWRPDPVPMYHTYLEEMVDLTNFVSGFPFGNDIGWSREDYVRALETDALIVRQQLGFPETMPDLPENPRVILPESFQGLPEWTPDPQPVFPADNDSGGSSPQRHEPVPDLQHQDLQQSQEDSHETPRLEDQPQTIHAAKENPLSIEEIKKHLERIAEEVGIEADEWNEPATEEEIAEAEKAFGVTFPETYKQMLRIHNGTDMGDFPSLKEALATSKELEEIEEEFGEGSEKSKNLSEDKPGVLKNGVYRRGWVPLYDFGTGVVDCLDCDPGPNGTLGQVVRYDPGGVEGVDYASLEEWLKEFDGS